MQKRMGSFIFILLLLIGVLLGNILSQFFTQRMINPAGIIGVLVGFVLAVLLHLYSQRKKSSVKWSPNYDERQLSHFAWAGAWSFFFLIFLLMGALIQPWIAHSESSLWVAILLAGIIYYLVAYTILEIKSNK